LDDDRSYDVATGN